MLCKSSTFNRLNKKKKSRKKNSSLNNEIILSCNPPSSLNYVIYKISCSSHFWRYNVGSKNDSDNSGWHPNQFKDRNPTLFAVMDDVLAEQVIVAEHHRGAQRGEMLLHPNHLLLQHCLAGNLLLDPGQVTQRQRKRDNRSAVNHSSGSSYWEVVWQH